MDDVELDNGMVAKREIVSHPGGVSVAILTEKNELLFVKQFRCPYQEELLELPAGKLEPGEDPFEAMKREQLEETGTTGKNYISLGNLYPTPGYCGEIIRLWACRVDKETGELSLDPDEFLQTLRIPLDKAVEMVLHNEIPDSKNPGGHLKDRRPGGKGAAVTPAPPEKGEPFMKKRMLAVALCAALLVGASACSQTEADSSSQVSTPSVSVVESEPSPTPEPTPAPTATPAPTPEPESSAAPAEGFEAEFAANPIDQRLEEDLMMASSSSLVLQAYDTAAGCLAGRHRHPPTPRRRKPSPPTNTRWCSRSRGTGKPPWSPLCRRYAPSTGRTRWPPPAPWWTSTRSVPSPCASPSTTPPAPCPSSPTPPGRPRAKQPEKCPNKKEGKALSGFPSFFYRQEGEISLFTLLWWAPALPRGDSGKSPPSSAVPSSSMSTWSTSSSSWGTRAKVATLLPSWSFITRTPLLGRAHTRTLLAAMRMMTPSSLMRMMSSSMSTTLMAATSPNLSVW